MARKFLDISKVCALLKEVRGKREPESVILPPKKIKKPASLTQLVTVTRRSQHYVNTEGVA